MTKKKARLGILLLLIAMSINASGCKTLGNVLNSMFQKPKVRYKTMRLKNVSFKGMAMDFDFILSNPNAVGVTLTHFSYDLNLDGNTFAKGTTKRAMELKHNGEGPLRVPFGVEFQKLAKSLLAFFQKKDSVSYRLSVQVGFQTPIGEVILPPITTRGRIPVPKLPKMRVVGVALGAMSLMGATLNFKVGMKNEGKFPIKMRGFDYGFRISGINIGGGNTKLTGLRPGGEQIMTIPLKVNFMKVGMAIAGILRSKKLPYDFSGKIDLGLFKLPFNLKGTSQL